MLVRKNRRDYRGTRIRFNVGYCWKGIAAVVDSSGEGEGRTSEIKQVQLRIWRGYGWGTDRGESDGISTTSHRRTSWSEGKVPIRPK